MRSAVEKPRWIARPLSISSEAITTSTSPGVGKMLITGVVADGGGGSRVRGRLPGGSISM